ncbi:MAG: type I glutamate--ammonia ligase [Dehalococcoidia bacterium]
MQDLHALKERMEAAGVARVDLRVTDLLGRWHHFSVPADHFSGESVTRGVGFDGSSLRGFQSIDASDMLLLPDLASAVIDPTEAVPTMAIICDVVDPLSGARYSRDPRYVAAKAEAHLAASGVADTAYFGPELEFFVFDDVRFQQSGNTAFYYVDSGEGDWNAGRDEAPNLGFKIPAKEGYAPVPPLDALSSLRWEMAEAIQRAGVEVEVHHHEVASGGQCEIATRFAPPRRKADETQWYKHIVRNVARANRRVATFMPKPLFGDNGSGMHTHQSLWKGGVPLFFDSNGYAGLSQTARYYIGGLLAHAPALLALCAPGTNSYKRLVPGFEAPVNLAYSARNRSAAVRIPTYSDSPGQKRVEFRPPDGTANPYLAFAAMLMAGLDGVQRQIDPGDPLERNIYELKPEDAARVPRVPATLEAALDALEADRAFLLAGDVFTPDLLERWIAIKRDEVEALQQRPTPYEFEQYFNG